MSIEAIRNDYLIGFILGVLGIAFGISLISYQFFNYGYLVNSSSDPYGIFAGWATLGVVSLAAGAIAVFYTYQIFIPLKNSTSTLARDCPNCGAIVNEDASVCEKCKQQLD